MRDNVHFITKVHSYQSQLSTQTIHVTVPKPVDMAPNSATKGFSHVPVKHLLVLSEISATSAAGSKATLTTNKSPHRFLFHFSLCFLRSLFWPGFELNFLSTRYSSFWSGSSGSVSMMSSLSSSSLVSFSVSGDMYTLNLLNLLLKATQSLSLWALLGSF